MKQAVKKRHIGEYAVTVVCVVLGFLLALQLVFGLFEYYHLPPPPIFLRTKSVV